MERQAPIHQLGIMWECGRPELDQKLGKELDLERAGPPGSLLLSAPRQTQLCLEEVRRRVVEDRMSEPSSPSLCALTSRCCEETEGVA